jgi:hypothetical protein
MIRQMQAVFVATMAFALAWASPARADDCDLVNQRVQDLGAEPGYFVVYPVNDDYLARSFPNTSFCAVIFRQWPVGIYPPEGSGLEESNVGVVQGGVISFITSTDDEGSFFLGQLGPAPLEDDAKDAGRSWLRLSEELKQDLFYGFSAPAVAYIQTPAGAEVNGRVTVESGGQGQIDATLVFDGAGNLTAVRENANLIRGVRPICQATKLLDRDPIVRRMAEQDLVVMGHAVKPYLDVRRASASPKLRAAIDRIWQRILDEGR